MKIGLSLPLVIASFAPLCCAQTATPPPAAPAAAPAAAQTPPKPHGPEKVAAQDPNRIVATIDGQKITAKQAVDLLKPFPPDQRKQLDANLSNSVQQIYTQHQFADAARKLNLEDKSPWKEQLELTREGVLARAYISHLQDAAKNEPVDDPQKYYDAHQSEYETAKLSGIFVGFNPPGTPANNAAPNARTEEQARDKAGDIEKKLKAGGDFAAIARSDSEHQTASKGGDLGTVPINDPELKIPVDVKTAVAKLQPGEVTEPIRIPGAFLIVKLDAREKVSFEKAKDGIVQKLQTERSQGAVKKEVDKYTIHVEDPDFFDTGVAPSPKIPSLQRPAAAAQPKP
jgi:PPIC-type peptidyl-prolyl cis-trans isomerase-like protein